MHRFVPVSAAASGSRTLFRQRLSVLASSVSPPTHLELSSHTIDSSLRKRSFHTSWRRDGNQSRRGRSPAASSPDPFVVLGFSSPTKSSSSSSHTSPLIAKHTAAEQPQPDAPSYADVKKAFLQLALRYHPDTAGAATAADQEQNKERFLAARRAFEQITAGPHGRAVLRSDSDDDQWQEEDMNTWFHTQTGYDMPFMDLQTMKEVAAMTEQIGGGLERDGGMWALARMVANAVKQGGDGRDLLRLEAGESRTNLEIDGELRRRRR